MKKVVRSGYCFDDRVKNAIPGLCLLSYFGCWATCILPEGFVGFENAYSRAKTYVTYVHVDGVHFYESISVFLYLGHRAT